MKKQRENFIDKGCPFPEEVKIVETENENASVIISDQFLYSFKKYINQMDLRVAFESEETVDPQGKAYFTVSLSIEKVDEKTDLIQLVRAFLDAMKIDWFEDVHEDSEDPDFVFCLPMHSMLVD